MKLLLGLIDKFERANPDIKVKPIHIAGDFSAKLQTMIAADRAPDVFYLVSQDCNDYLHKRALRDLQPFIDKSKAIKLDDFYQDTVKQFRIEGKTYALSCNWSPMVVFYNKDFFDEAGVPYPKPGWTWTDFLQTAQKLTVRDDRGRVQRFGTMSVDWKQWVVQAGGDFFNEAGDNCTLDSPESLKGLQFAYDLTAKYNVCPPQNDAEAESSIYFMAGKTAMVFSYRWFITLLEPLKRYQWGICASPKGDKNVNLSGALGFAMSSQSKRPDAAWRFIEFMTGPPGQ
ncbi:MAG: sugar ABC transporter substrate-binding protein, partial [Armatimonadota bacterium]